MSRATTSEIVAPGAIMARGDILDRSDHLHKCAACGGLMVLEAHQVKATRGGPTVSPAISCPRHGCGATYTIRSGRITWA